MTTCSACGQSLPSSPGGTSAPPREYVSIGAPEKFAALCRTLSTMPEANDRNREALESLPQAVGKYKQLTSGQWKMFCAIHKQITGAWPPPKEAFAKEDPPMNHGELPASLDDIPLPF